MKDFCAPPQLSSEQICVAKELLGQQIACQGDALVISAYQALSDAWNTSRLGKTSQSHVKRRAERLQKRCSFWFPNLFNEGNPLATEASDVSDSGSSLISLQAEIARLQLMAEKERARICANLRNENVEDEMQAFNVTASDTAPEYPPGFGFSKDDGQ